MSDKLQNRAARVIARSSYDTSSSSVLEELGWNNLYTNRKMQKAILMYKVMNNLTPMYLQELFVTRVSHYRLGDSEGKLFLPKPRTDYLKRSLSSFKRSLKTNNAI